MAMKISVQFGQSRKPVEISSNSEEDVLRAIRQAFSPAIQQNEKLLLQLWDADFHEFFDLTDFESIGDRSKVNVVKCEPARQNDAENVEGEESDEDDNEDIGVREKTGGKMIPANYSLPAFDLSLKNELMRGTALTSVMRKRVVKALYADMVKYITDMYPLPIEYSRVVDSLLREYPHVADNPLPGMAWANIANDGYTWRDALRTKFKFERRKLGAGVKHVATKRALYAAKDPKQPPPADWVDGLLRSTASKLNKCPAVLPEYGPGETKVTTIQHQEGLKQEFAKDNPDADVISALMDASMVNRRFLMSKGTVKEVQKFYPHLSSAAEWMAEVRRQFNGLDIANAMAKFFSATKLNKLYALLVSKPKGAELATKILETHPDDVNMGKKMAIVMGLPWICQEAAKHWILTYDVVATSNPLILVASEGGDNQFLSATYTPYLDGVALVREKLAFIEAVEVLAAGVFLMNASYPCRNVKSWRVLCELMFGLPPTDVVTPALQKIINIM